MTSSRRGATTPRGKLVLVVALLAAAAGALAWQLTRSEPSLASDTQQRADDIRQAIEKDAARTPATPAAPVPEHPQDRRGGPISPK